MGLWGGHPPLAEAGIKVDSAVLPSVEFVNINNATNPDNPALVKFQNSAKKLAEAERTRKRRIWTNEKALLDWILHRDCCSAFPLADGHNPGSLGCVGYFSVDCAITNLAVLNFLDGNWRRIFYLLRYSSGYYVSNRERYYLWTGLDARSRLLCIVP
jgi:hypothetical protein